MRQISILKNNYKILTKALASRLPKILPSLINPDHVGYMKSRFIEQFVTTIFNMINLADIEAIAAYIAL